MKIPSKKYIVCATAVVTVLAGGIAYWFVTRTPTPHFVTIPVTQGDVVTAITASGSVNPVVTVQVGSYVSGTIQAMHCDYNTRVRKGQLCAKIDPKPYQVIVDEDRADLATAEAQLNKDQANLIYTQVSQKRQDVLFSQDSTSHDSADTARNANRQALALVRLDAAQVRQKAAMLRAAQISLDYTNIVSPVDGTVVSRNVTIGQTVAASFATPTLFLIATDLTKMQVDTNVSESDIAGAKEAATASFTVDAFPKKSFGGIVTQVRQAPISVQNVITYDVVVTVSNPGLLLKPGMTATTQITTARAINVLRVPSQALRFTPTNMVTAPRSRHTLWVIRNGKPSPVAVEIGLDDGTFVQIKSGNVTTNDQVIVSQSASAPATKHSAAPAALRL